MGIVRISSRLSDRDPKKWVRPKDMRRHARLPVVPPENSEQPKGRRYSSKWTAMVDGLADPAWIWWTQFAV